MKQLLTFFYFTVISCAAHSQQIDLVVSDSITNEALPYVTVYLKKHGIGTTTNLNGEAHIAINDTSIHYDTLICSYIGYEKERIPVSIDRSIRMNISLTPSFQDIGEVNIVASKKVLSAKKIIKKALKNTSENYTNTPTNLEGLYRETFTENDKAIYLNEASIKLHYDQYPQGKFQRFNWENWHYDDRYAFELTNSYFNGFPNQFNSKDDRFQLLEARSTENWSKYGYKGSIIGGPMSITSKDYPKYQSDFLDSKNFNKYAYEKAGQETVNGTTCYVINFYPLETGRRMVMDYSKKLHRSIYVGKMYIEKESFAFMKLEFQLAKNVDFGYYTQFVPLDYTVQIDYHKQQEVWSLKTIRLTQLRSLDMRLSDQKVLYESVQELFFTKIETKSVTQIPSVIEWKHTRSTSLRDFESPYHPEYWENYEENTYPPLPDHIKKDLTHEKPLEEQFKGRFKQKTHLSPPIAQKVPHTFNYPTENLTDDYQWFSEPEKSTEFYQYIEQENTYADNYIIAARRFQKKFYNSIRGFYPKDTVESVRHFRKGQLILDTDSLDNYIYYEYLNSSDRTPILNLSNFMQQRKNCFVEDIKFSKNNIGICYTTNGGLTNSLIILEKGNSTVLDSLSEIYSYEWLNDTIMYYAKKNSVKRSDKLFRRNIQKRESELLKHELDLTYDISVSQSESFLFCTIQSKNESEIFVLNKAVVNAELELLIERKKDVYNEVKEFNGSIYLLTNENALNNRIAVYEYQTWREIVPHSKNRLITDFICTYDYILLNGFKDGLCEITYKRKDERKWSTLEFPTEIHSIAMFRISNDSILVSYSSPASPHTLYHLDLQKGKLNQVETTKINFQYDYTRRFTTTKRVFARAKDGKKIPITLSKSTSPKRKHKGLILKVYGSYGAYPGGVQFSAEDQILLRDGFTIAYAHVRGGSILGNQWYADGKLLNKENSFNDYLACAEYLIKKKHTDAKHLVGYGQSAGGLVVGVAINRRPELFNTVIFDHAYLDVLTTMMNDTLPLTTDHYKEVGNPQEKVFYDYIKAYSPYQNIRAQDYPNLLFIGSSNDYQTPNWQIAKYVARLREMNTSDSTILFKTDIGSGHIGSTQNDQWMRDLSFMNAFIYGNLFL